MIYQSAKLSFGEKVILIKENGIEMTLLQMKKIKQAIFFWKLVIFFSMIKMHYNIETVGYFPNNFYCLSTDGSYSSSRGASSSGCCPSESSPLWPAYRPGVYDDSLSHQVVNSSRSLKQKISIKYKYTKPHSHYV